MPEFGPVSPGSLTNTFFNLTSLVAKKNIYAKAFQEYGTNSLKRTVSVFLVNLLNW